MSLTLAFDTTAEACSVALMQGNDVLADARESCPRGHASVLVPMIERVLADADVPVRAVETVGVAVGPGSFTGIRTGIAAAKGLVLALDACAVGISGLWAVAWRALEDTDRRAPVLCVLETRRSDYFVQRFHADGTEGTAPMVLDDRAVCQLVERSGCILAGNAVSRLLSACPELGACPQYGPGKDLPDAVDIARLANRARVDGIASIRDLSPLYLRRASTTRPAPGKGAAA